MFLADLYHNPKKGRKMNKFNGVKSCVIFLVGLGELGKKHVSPHIYFDIAPDRILLPVLEELSTPTSVTTISFSMGKFSTLFNVESGGKIRTISLKKLAEKNIVIPVGSKNHNNLGILTALGSGKEIGAVIYLPD
jgi:hypothetical protein